MSLGNFFCVSYCSYLLSIWRAPAYRRYVQYYCICTYRCIATKPSRYMFCFEQIQPTCRTRSCTDYTTAFTRPWCRCQSVTSWLMLWLYLFSMLICAWLELYWYCGVYALHVKLWSTFCVSYQKAPNIRPTQRGAMCLQYFHNISPPRSTFAFLIFFNLFWFISICY